MKLLYLILLPALFLSGCGRSSEPSGVPAGQPASAPDEPGKVLSFVVAYGNPFTVKQFDYLWFPVALMDKERPVLNFSLQSESDKNSDYSFDSGSFSRTYKTGNVSLINVLFYHKTTGQKHLLTDQKLQLQSITVPVVYPADTTRSFALYQVIEKDFNKDGVLNQADPVILYISDTDGKNFRRLTTPNRHAIDWQLMSKANFLIVRTFEDSNKDGQMNHLDEMYIEKISLENPAQRDNIFDDASKAKIKALLK